MKLPGRDTQIYTAIRDNLKPLLGGTVLVIDPSMGSLSSMPGWALYQAGELVESGMLVINPKGLKWERLRELHRLLRNMSKLYEPDLCVFEQVPVSAHGGRSQVSHASLLYAVGVTMCAVTANSFIGVTPVVWKARVRPSYVKGDEQDAIEMGYVLIELAKQIATVDPKHVYRTHTDTE